MKEICIKKLFLIVSLLVLCVVHTVFLNGMEIKSNNIMLNDISLEKSNNENKTEIIKLAVMFYTFIQWYTFEFCIQDSYRYETSKKIIKEMLDFDENLWLLDTKLLFNKDLLNPMYFVLIGRQLELAKLFHKKNKKLIFDRFLTEEYTLLHMGIFSHSCDIVDWLIKEGLKVDDICINKTTPLHLAATFNAFDCAEVLIESIDHKGLLKEYLLLQDKNGYSAINCSINNNNASFVKYLVYKGADYREIDKYGNSCIKNAIIHKAFDVLEALYEIDSTIINDIDKDGKSSLFYALDTNQEVIALWLIDQSNIDLQLIDIKKENALHCAVRAGLVSVVKVLIQKDLSLQNQKNSQNKIPCNVIQDINSPKGKLLKRLLSENIKNKETNKTQNVEFSQSAYDDLIKLSHNKPFKKSKPKKSGNKQTPKKNSPKKDKTTVSENNQISENKKSVDIQGENVQNVDNEVENLSDILSLMTINSIENNRPSKKSTKNDGFKKVSSPIKKFQSNKKIKPIEGHIYELCENGDVKIIDSSRCSENDCFGNKIEPSIIIIKAPAEMQQKNYLVYIAKYVGSAELKSENENDYYHSFSPLVEFFGHYGIVRDHSSFIDMYDRRYLPDCCEKYKICIKASLEYIHLQNGTKATQSCPVTFEFIILKNKNHDVVCSHRYCLRDDLIKKKN